MESISNNIKLVEIKKQNLRKTLDSLHDNASSVLFLTLQWKELETHFSSSLDLIKEREKELFLVQNSIDNKFKELKSREKELGLAQESIRERFDELGVKERRLGLVQGEVKERFGELEMREREFEAKRKVEIEERCGEIERVQRELEMVRREIEESLREIGVKEKRFEVVNVSVAEKSRELLEIQGLINVRLREIEVREKGLEECSRDLEAKEKRLEERLQEMELNERQFKERWRELELREKGIVEKCGEIELKEKQMEEFYEELKKKEKQLEERFKEFEERAKESELHDKRFEEWSTELELKGKQDENLEEQYKGLKLKEKQNEERVKELVMKEKKFASTLHSRITMDGKNLQMYLLQHWEEHDSLRNEVFEALKLSPNPAKLVLEAMQPRLKKIDGKKLQMRVLRKISIFLLEQLMKVSPDINPKVKNEAMELASDWFNKMNNGSGTPLDFLVFLLLLASYGLASAFDADRLLQLSQNVAHYRLAPEIWRGLGFADKIPGFIRTIKTKQPLEAIRYIYAFELIDEFPPVPLLEGFLNQIDKDVEKCYHKEDKSRRQIQATNKILHAMRAIVGCIEDHKLESVRSPQYLKRQIASLEKLIANSEETNPVLGCKVQPQEQSVNRCIAPTIAGAAAPASFIQSQLKKGSKRPWTVVLAETARNDSVRVKSADQASCNILSSVELPENFQKDRIVASSSPNNQPEPNYVSVSMDGRGLRLLLDKQMEYASMRTEVSNALQSVTDPAELALDAIKGLHPSNLEGVEGFRSWILLLELLGGVSPQIKPQVQKEAKKFATDWTSKLKNKRADRFEVVCLWQFLVAYGLVSFFDADELLGLFDNDALVFCKDLGLEDLIPCVIQKLIKKEKWLEAIKHIFALDLVDKFPPVPLLKDYMQYSKKKAEQYCKKENYSLAVQAIDKELKSLKAVIKCIMDYKLEAECWPKILEERLPLLEKWKKCMSEAISSAAVASSLSIPQPHQQNKKKRRRIASTKAPLNASVGATSTVHPRRPPHQPPAGFLMIDGAPYLNTSSRGFPPDEWQMNNNINPYNPRGALRRPGYYNEPLPFGGPGGAPLEPANYNWPGPFGGHGLPPYRHPSFFP